MYMYVCIYLRKEKGGSAAGGRAASNMDGTLVLLRRRCRFSFHAMLLPTPTNQRLSHSTLVHAKGYARTDA